MSDAIKMVNAIGTDTIKVIHAPDPVTSLRLIVSERDTEIEELRSLLERGERAYATIVTEARDDLRPQIAANAAVLLASMNPGRFEFDPAGREVLIDLAMNLSRDIMKRTYPETFGNLPEGESPNEEDS